MESYRGPQVCKLAGISYRQLDYWARIGALIPSLREAHGSGTQRLYSEEDLRKARIMAHFLEAGISFQQVRRIIKEVETFREGEPMLILSPSGDWQCFIVPPQSEENPELAKSGVRADS